MSGNTGRDSKVMDQADHLPTTVLYRRAHFRQSDRIASMEKQFNIRVREFLGNRATNSAAGTGDKISLHRLRQKG
jgi:predicted HicB family RNase H-like nuclease